MPEDQAPPVVAVVVASDPGPWFEDCLRSLTHQDYDGLSVLVIDAGSIEPLAVRVAAVAPDVYLHRLSKNAGFGPSANVVTEVVDGAAHYLFCHDDVVLEPDAVSRLVEEAFRSNAGIVGPKLVDLDQPDRILQLGLGVDRFGAPLRRVGHREFDQSQHDEAREVFAIPGGCTLVRADLFSAIGGFDRTISMFGEDVDLCWRARLAGARIVVVPTSIVKHLEATAACRRPLQNARALQWRHELRAVLKNYGPLRRTFVSFQLIILSIIEVAYFLARGRRRRASEVIAAWRWNFAAPQGLRAARAEVMASRHVSDHILCQLFTRRTFRIWRYSRPLLEESIIRWNERRNPFLTPGSARSPQRPSYRSRRNIVIAGIGALIIILGSRSLIFGHLPIVGEYLPLRSPTDFLGMFLGGTTDSGMQNPGPASPAFGLLGLFGLVALGGMGVVAKVGLIGSVIVGAIGVSRLIRPFGPPSARLGGALAYLFLPLVWDDLAHGDVRGVIIYGAMPYVLLRLAVASGIAPFVAGDPPKIRSRVTIYEIASFGLLLAIVGSFVPTVVPLAVVIGIVFFFGSIAAGQGRSGVRSVVVAIGGAGLSFVLCLPWSLTFVQPGAKWSAIIGTASSPFRTPSLSALMRFNVGPIGAGHLGFSWIAAALAVLFVGRDHRLLFAIRLWIVTLGAFGLSWAASEGWLGSGGGAFAILLAPAAVSIAALVGLGVAALFSDLHREHFGWRHVGVVGFGLCGLVGVVPILGASVSGRWGVPATGYDAILSFTNPTGADESGQRVLWLGDPAAFPLLGWQITPGFSAAVSSGGLPDATRLWPSANPGAASSLIAAVQSAESGRTVRLGHLIASSGIRYVVVPTAFAPVLADIQAVPSDPPPQSLLDALGAQSDFRELPTEGGTLVFENVAWRSGFGLDPAGRHSAGTPAAVRTVGVVLSILLWVGCVTLLARRKLRTRRSHGRGREHGAYQLEGDVRDELIPLSLGSTSSLFSAVNQEDDQ